MDSGLLLHAIVGVNGLLFLWESYLIYRQRSKHQSIATRPNDVESIISEEDFIKARSYSIDRLSFKMLRMMIECAIMIVMLYGGYYSYLWYLAVQSSYPIAAFMSLHSITSFLFDMPLSLYENFVLEESHGFNKYSFSFYMVDAIKKLVLSIAITIPLGAGAVWLIENGGDYFFIYLWIFISVVILCMMTVYPSYIAPLFDQYSPLPEGELKCAIEALAGKLHYPLTKIYVVDGSTRSGHSNAYLFGFWKNKRIVLYDTLLSGEERRKALGKEEKKEMDKDGKVKEDNKGMNVEEVGAILGHELGHWALSHTARNLGAALLNILLALFCFSFFHKNEALASAFGFSGGAPSLISLLVIMQYVMGVYNEAASLFTVFITRTMEFEADAFAAQLGLGPQLATALIKLSKDNLSLPINDYLYSLCRHTHPPVPERIETLKKFIMMSRLITRSGVGLSKSLRRSSSAIEKKKESDMLETINIEDLPRAQKRFAKQFEKVNEERIKEMFARNYKNHIAFGALAVLVVGIYFYTMYAVKQETFLEEIDQEVAAEKPATHGHLATSK